MKFSKRTPAPEKSLPINAAAVEFLNQLAMLSSYFRPGGGRVRAISCARCGRGGEEITVNIGKGKFVVGGATLAAGDENEVLIGSFEPVVERHESGVVMAVGTRLISPPIRKTGRVKIRCLCGERRQWHTPAG